MIESTKEITFSITSQQELFLKRFAENHYPGAYDNHCTAYPIHFVENKRYHHIPYSEDIKWAYEDEPLVFTFDSDYEHWQNSEVETVREFYECSGEDCSIEIKHFTELDCKDVTSVSGKEIFVTNYNDYFEVYGVKLQAMAWQKEYYEKTALFFVREEAEKYVKYQAHNLNEPRIYTYSSGYANKGDYTHFWDLLMSVGTKLREEVNP